MPLSLARHQRLRNKSLLFFVQNAGLSAQASAQLWETLKQAYTEPHRAYHNLVHLESVFEALAHPLGAKDLPAQVCAAVQMAVWFHDFVYKVSPDEYPFNELRSAQALEELLPQSFIRDLAAEFIVATKAHLVPEGGVFEVPEHRAACELFLDADLSILAADDEALMAYDRGIAQEWGQDPDRPDLAFCLGRAQALQSFALRERLFMSERFESLEPFARKNLDKLIAYWRDRAEQAARA